MGKVDDMTNYYPQAKERMYASAQEPLAMRPADDSPITYRVVDAIHQQSAALDTLSDLLTKLEEALRPLLPEDSSKGVTSGVYATPPVPLIAAIMGNTERVNYSAERLSFLLSRIAL